MRRTHNGCARTHTHTHKHSQCDKYGFSLVRIIHRGHLQDILCPFKLPPTSQKQDFNERGQIRAVLTGGTRSWGRTQKSWVWLMGGGGAEWSKWQGISHIMASQAPYRASPGQRSSGHQATDPCPQINTPPYAASIHICGRSQAEK